MAEMKIGGETFHVELGGDEKAPPLMLSNSLGSNLRMWEAQMPELNRHFRTIRYDSRGHGASAAPARPYSIAELAGDALAILDQLGVERAHWLGLSKGGMVGQWLLAHRPDRIGRAVLANTAAVMGPADLWNQRIRTAREDGLASLVPFIIGRWFTDRFREKNPEEAERIADMYARTPPQGYAGCCAAIRDMDLREAVRSISNPVLVIVGRHDPSTPPEAGAALAEAIPGAKLKALNAAHLSNIEQPEAFTRAVVDFLKTGDASMAGRAARKTAKKAVKKAARKAVKKAAGTGPKKASKKAARKASRATVKPSAAKAAKKNAARKTKPAPGKAAAPKSPAKKTAARKSTAGKAKGAPQKTKAAAGKTARKATAKRAAQGRRTAR